MNYGQKEKALKICYTILFKNELRIMGNVNLTDTKFVVTKFKINCDLLI